MSEVLQDVRTHVVPGMTHWQHPDFFAFFPAQLSPPALFGDLLANAFNQPGFTWMASPAATELEVIVANWLVEAFGFPADFRWDGTGGTVLQPSATEAAVVAMLAAKKKKLATLPTQDPVNETRLVAYVSDQSHFCIEKAAKVLCIPHFRKVPATWSEETQNYVLSPQSLQRAIEEDVNQGLIPFFLSLNFGATGTCSVDPVAHFASLVKEYDLWLNVDGAYAGVVAICPEYQELLHDAGRLADSILINGSKWFSMIFNASFMFFREKKYIASTLNASGVYLDNKHTAQQAVVDFKDYHIGLGRPFRALKFYSTMKSFGLEGLRATIRRHMALATYLHQQLAALPQLHLPVATQFGLVIFCLNQAPTETPQDCNKRAKDLLEKLNATQQMFLVHTIVLDKVAFRISLAYPALEYADMDRIVTIIKNNL